jgi:hypothetical protein
LRCDPRASQMGSSGCMVCSFRESIHPNLF